MKKYLISGFCILKERVSNLKSGTVTQLFTFKFKNSRGLVEVREFQCPVIYSKGYTSKIMEIS